MLQTVKHKAAPYHREHRQTEFVLRSFCDNSLFVKAYVLRQLPLNPSVRSMKEPNAVQLFAGRPKSTAILAFVVAGLGFVFISTLVPATSAYRYLPGHDWVMAIVCWGLALFMAYCSYLGFHRNRRAREN